MLENRLVLSNRHSGSRSSYRVPSACEAIRRVQFDLHRFRIEVGKIRADVLWPVAENPNEISGKRRHRAGGIRLCPIRYQVCCRCGARFETRVCRRWIWRFNRASVDLIHRCWHSTRQACHPYAWTTTGAPRSRPRLCSFARRCCTLIGS